ncbi:MAG: MBL fold metallo-hydrolase [Sediminibacterium sp.]|nr:MBL fold metallo-hydrolase [Sediminibacterium sp.]
MQVFHLWEGNFWATQDKLFIPIPLVTKNEQIIKPEHAIKISVQPFLVICNNDYILCDSGLGNFQNATNALEENLKKLNINSLQITKILISHLHRDHCYGLLKNTTSGWKLNFPNAKIYIKRAEYDYALNQMSSSYNKEFIINLKTFEKNIIWIESDYEWIDNYILVEKSGGHCPFHQVFKIIDQGQIVFYGGDELPQEKFLIYNLKAFYDYAPEKARDLRKNWKIQSSTENWQILYYHDIPIETNSN